MSIAEFIAAQQPERQQVMTEIHEIILEEDKTVKPEIATMMGKEMIIYNAPGTFKYGLSSVKKYLSLHVLPIYAVPELHATYKALLPGASFQKGCINFEHAEQMPAAIVRQLIRDCAKIDLQAIRQKYLESKAKR